MACISRFATAVLSGETELALGTIRVKKKRKTRGLVDRYQSLKSNLLSISCSHANPIDFSIKSEGVKLFGLECSINPQKFNENR